MLFRSGKKAVEIYVANGRYDTLIDIAGNEKLPQSVREEATSVLELRAEALANSLGIKPINPLARNGTLSNGTVERPPTNRQNIPPKGKVTA